MKPTVTTVPTAVPLYPSRRDIEALYTLIDRTGIQGVVDMLVTAEGTGGMCEYLDPIELEEEAKRRFGLIRDPDDCD